MQSEIKAIKNIVYKRKFVFTDSNILKFLVFLMANGNTISVNEEVGNERDVLH